MTSHIDKKELTTFVTRKFNGYRDDLVDALYELLNGADAKPASKEKAPKEKAEKAPKEKASDSKFSAEVLAILNKAKKSLEKAAEKGEKNITYNLSTGRVNKTGSRKDVRTCIVDFEGAQLSISGKPDDATFKLVAKHGTCDEESAPPAKATKAEKAKAEKPSKTETDEATVKQDAWGRWSDANGFVYNTDGKKRVVIGKFDGDDPSTSWVVPLGKRDTNKLTKLGIAFDEKDKKFIAKYNEEHKDEEEGADADEEAEEEAEEDAEEEDAEEEEEDAEEEEEEEEEGDDGEEDGDDDVEALATNVSKTLTVGKVTVSGDEYAKIMAAIKAGVPADKQSLSKKTRISQAKVQAVLDKPSTFALKMGVADDELDEPEDD